MEKTNHDKSHYITFLYDMKRPTVFLDNTEVQQTDTEFPYYEINNMRFLNSCSGNV